MVEERTRRLRENDPMLSVVILQMGDSSTPKPVLSLPPRGLRPAQAAQQDGGDASRGSSADESAREHQRTALTGRYLGSGVVVCDPVGA